MIPSLDHSLHYRASFRLNLREDPIVAWNEIVRMIRAWVGARIPESTADNTFGAKWFFVGGEWRPKKSARIHVRSDRLDGGGNAELPDFWACRFEHPCSKVAARQWRTDIGISALPDTDLLFSLSTIHWLPPGYIGQPENPIPTAPSIVGQILNSRKWQSLAGSEQLSTIPFLVRDGQAAVLVEHLSSPQRTCPIAYITRDFLTGLYLVNPYSLAKVLAGTASVYMAESSWTDKELEAMLPVGFRCWNGMVRVFQPRLDFGKDFDARRHRYFRKEEIEDIGREAIAELLVRGIVRRSLAPQFSGVTTIEEIGQKKKEAHLRQLKLNAQGQKDANAWAQLLEQDNERLAGEIKQKEDELKYWQAAAEQIDDFEDEVNRLKYELNCSLEKTRQAESVTNALAARAAVVQGLERLPNSVSDVVSLVEKLYPDRISFTERAKKSAQQASIKSFNVAWDCLRAMATVLYDLYFQKKLPLREIANQFMNRTGFELAVGESETTKSNKKLAAQRKDTYKGQTIDISTHVKHGNSPGNILRVHYFAHSGDQKLVIGHCGDHLDTIKTN